MNLSCLQEIWLWTFEESTLENIIPNYEGFTRCSDLYENISNFQIPRGKGGIAIMWPRVWSNSVKKLEEGSERVHAVEINTTEGSLSVINVIFQHSDCQLPKSYTKRILSWCTISSKHIQIPIKLLHVVILMEPCLIRAQIHMTWCSNPLSRNITYTNIPVTVVYRPL